MDLAEDLTDGDDCAQPPEVISFVKLQKVAGHCGAAEAVKGAQSRVYLPVNRPCWAGRTESGAGQMDEAMQVTFPKALGAGVAAGLEVADPARD
jgi:hypothetical protein